MSFEDILQVSQIGCWSWLNGRVEWDEVTQKLFGRATNPPDYAAYLECIHPDDRAKVSANIEGFVREAHYDDIEHRVVLSDGRVRWLLARGAAVLDASGVVVGLKGVVLDITDRKLREVQVAEDAVTDPLTGLRNRRWLEEEVRRAVARSARGAAPFSLLLLDVDDFKRINDGPGGHDAGDRLLVELAARLRKHIRLGDALARYGGDEIVAFLPETALETAESVAHRLAAEVAGRSFEGIWSRVSIGIATWASGEEFADVLRRADHAMYRAKSAKLQGS